MVVVAATGDYDKKGMKIYDLIKSYSLLIIINEKQIYITKYKQYIARINARVAMFTRN